MPASFEKLLELGRSLANEDDFLVLDVILGRKPTLASTTEPREYHPASELRGESAFAYDCLGAEMMGSWDAEVGRPIPVKASDAYRQAYAATLERMKQGSSEQ